MENNPFLIYNTMQPALVISEYGRIIQDYVSHILQIEDREKRSKQAAALVLVMENLNPSVKEQADYKHKLWDHLHIIANFKLDVDSPYPVPSPEIQQMKPEPIPYPTQPIKFRFYGRNLQYMVAKAAEINDEGLKDDFVNLLASFMKNSSRSWNNEDLTNEMIANHLASMSQGKLIVSPESLEIKIDNSFKRKKNFKPNKNFSKYKKNNNYKNYR
jgi:hypothetical protein